MTIDVNSFSS